MLAFIYDDTFEGLLSAVFDAYTMKAFPEVVATPKDALPLTVSRTHTVTTDRNKADRVFTGLGKRMSREGRNVVLLAFLSEEKDIGTLLFRYMRKLFDLPPGTEGDFTDPDMLAVDQIAKKVYGEHHLLLGFARFQKTAEGIYAALLGPKYNVLSLLIPHFRKRFATHPWILYDAKRGFGFFHDKGAIKDIYIAPAHLAGGVLAENLLDPEEKTFETMWRSYFAAAAIAERTNPTLQVRCLPRRFWPYMTEMRLPG
ncbi:MAG: hypothetical protein DELT_01533 [Desulfovibrio sp.]